MCASQIFQVVSPEHYARHYTTAHPAVPLLSTKPHGSSISGKDLNPEILIYKRKLNALVSQNGRQNVLKEDKTQRQLINTSQ